jgi:microcystin-dependent protein
MKSKLLFLSVLMLLAVFGSFAQITTTGMAIQGIARDATTNNAITNSTISLKFTVYYGATPVNAIPSVTPTVTTDAFGVFSYTLDVSEIENKIIYDKQLFLKIEQTSPSNGVISDEKLNFVPYAVSASNGVPTGSIMPFVGTTAPRGWWLCDGSTLPSKATELITLIGSNAPDLRGMFLSGAGGSLTHVGPALKAVQEDLLGSHLHEKGTIATTSAGDHTHTTRFYNDDFNGVGGAKIYTGLENDGDGINNTDRSTTSNGAHTHTISGSTALTGGTETRPVNYGVNYIIKL